MSEQNGIRIESSASSASSSSSFCGYSPSSSCALLHCCALCGGCANKAKAKAKPKGMELSGGLGYHRSFVPCCCCCCCDYIQISPRKLSFPSSFPPSLFPPFSYVRARSVGDTRIVSYAHPQTHPVASHRIASQRQRQRHKTEPITRHAQ